MMVSLSPEEYICSMATVKNFQIRERESERERERERERGIFHIALEIDELGN